MDNTIIILHEEHREKEFPLFKNHILLEKMKKKIIYLDINKSINFIKSNNHKNIIFYGAYMEFHFELVKYLNIKGNNNNNIIFFSFDFWYLNHKKNKKNAKRLIDKDNYLNNIFKAKNHKVVCFCHNLEQLNSYHNFNYSQFSKNIIFLNIWGCYEKSFVRFNDNPIKKILISGVISKAYIERYILKNLKNNSIVCLNYNYNDYYDNSNNNYSQQLNKYYCCFASCIYTFNKKKKKIENTHIILQKTFEILATGSLLVCPKKEEVYLKNIGLIHNKNCYLIDFKIDLNKQIEFIFQNIDKYNIVRKNGQKIANEKFNFNNKFEEIINKIELK